MDLIFILLEVNYLAISDSRIHDLLGPLIQLKGVFALVRLFDVDYGELLPNGVNDGLLFELLVEA